jgi:hypothetical protein
MRPGTVGGASMAVKLALGYWPLGAELDSADGSILFRTPTLELVFALEIGWYGH